MVASKDWLGLRGRAAGPAAAEEENDGGAVFLARALGLEDVHDEFDVADGLIDDLALGYGEGAGVFA